MKIYQLRLNQLQLKTFLLMPWYFSIWYSKPFLSFRLKKFGVRQYKHITCLECSNK